MIRTKCVSGSTSAICCAARGMPSNGNMKPDKQDLRQEGEERDLERLDLGAGERGDQQAQRERGGDEHEARDVDVDERAADRHVEQEPPDQQDQRHLDHADHHVGQDLADHQLRRADRRVDQELEVAALALAHDRHRGEQHHRHGEDHAHQARHDLHLRAPLRVVVGAHLERVGCRARAAGDRARTGSCGDPARGARARSGRCRRRAAARARGRRARRAARSRAARADPTEIAPSRSSASSSAALRTRATISTTCVAWASCTSRRARCVPARSATPARRWRTSWLIA